MKSSILSAAVVLGLVILGLSAHALAASPNASVGISLHASNNQTVSSASFTSPTLSAGEHSTQHASPESRAKAISQAVQALQHHPQIAVKESALAHGRK